jgi:hypothetical protein
VQPIANLAPLWTVPVTSSEGWQLADADAQFVVLEREVAVGATFEREALVVDLATGARRLRVSGLEFGRTCVDLAGDSCGTPHLVAPGLLAVRRRGRTEAVEVSDGRVRWSVEGLNPIVFRLPAGLLLARGGTVRGLIALNGTDGGERWRAPVGDLPTFVVADEATVYVAEHAGPLVALDARTGRERWRRPCQIEALAVERGRVLAGCAGTAVVLDATDGAALITQDRRVFQWLSPSRLVAEEHLPGPPVAGGAIALYEVGAANVWWRRTLTADDRGLLGPRTVVRRDGLYVCSDSPGVLQVLNPSNGATEWILGVRHCAHENAPTFRVVPGEVGDVLIAPTNDGVTAFARAAEPLPLEHATVSGTVTMDGRTAPDVRVAVGPASVRTDARGRFRAEIQLRGAVRVEALANVLRARPRRRCVSLDTQTVLLDGSNRYRVDLANVSARCDDE